MNDRCEKCTHFGIHGEPRLMQFASGIKFGWTHHCAFDKKVTNPQGEPCARYVNRIERDNQKAIDKLAIADKYMAMDNKTMQQADLF
jgi:hypothetical protein